MNDEINRFPDLQTAIIWLAGVKALAGMPQPGNMQDLTWRLIDDGMAVVLRVPTSFGGVSCVAEFPKAMSETDLLADEWFGESEDALSRIQPAGNA